MTPSIDVIIVNYLTGDDAVAAAREVQGPATTIWIVDNSGEVLAHPPTGSSVLGDGTNVMYAAASNLAYDRGVADLVLLLNPDVRIARSVVEQLATALSDDPGLWAVAPRLESPNGASQPYLRRLATTAALLADLVPPLRPVLRSSYERYLCRDVDLSSTALIDQPAAACLLVRRADVGVRLFDPAYPLFFNDADLARRMAGLGRRCLYLGGLAAEHTGGASIARERVRSGRWVSEEYDRSAARYARRNLRGGWLVGCVVPVRRAVRRLLRSRDGGASTSAGNP